MSNIIRFYLPLAALIISRSTSFSQGADSGSVAPQSSAYRAAPDTPRVNYIRHDWFQIIGKENVSYKTSHLVLPSQEKMIFDMEVRECTAVKRRDTTALVNIWSHDFILEHKANTVVTNKTGLSYYVSLHRMIDAITALDDNNVTTTGTETYQIADPTKKLQPVSTRKFFHSWRRVQGNWKLVINR